MPQIFNIAIFLLISICSSQIIQENTDESSPNPSQESFTGGFLSSTYIIIISELGDKTFFIAAILATSNNRFIVYTGTMFALIIMTVLSSFVGYFMNFIPKSQTEIISAFLYLLFGLKMIRDGFLMTHEDSKEEFNEVKESLNNVDTESGGLNRPTSRIKSVLSTFLSPAFINAFILCFLAEWGDRSQFATIILAATKGISGVILGAVVGHGICSGIAVLAGRIISYKVPVKWLTIIGGLTFLAFSVHSFYLFSYGENQTLSINSVS